MALPLAASFSTCLVREALTLAQQGFQASGAVFYWINPDGNLTDFIRIGAPEPFFLQYHQGMAQHDPLLACRLIRNGRRVATLDDEHESIPSAHTDIYRRYLSAYGFSTCAELLFWRDEEAFAGVGLLKRPADPAVTTSALGILRAMQPVLERSLYLHPAVRSSWSASRLARRYHLTPREIEITGLLCNGATNSDVAEFIDISLATVKTHLIRIFDKLGVENRASLVALVLRLQLPS